MKIWEHCKVYSFLDANNTYSVSSYMYIYVQLCNTRVYLCKDDNIRHSVTYDIKKVYLCLVSDKSWKVCPDYSNDVTYMSLNNRIYDSEPVTMTIHYFNYIHSIQKLLHVCPNIYTHYPGKPKGQFSLCEQVHWLHIMQLSPICRYLDYEQFVCIMLIKFIIHSSFLCLHVYFVCVSVYVFSTYHVTHF